jgi:hypothetical protein
MELLSKYIEKYAQYMTSLVSDMSEIQNSIYHPNCPEYIKTTLLSTYELLADKQRDYEYMHNLIVEDPIKYETTIIQFLDNVS